MKNKILGSILVIMMIASNAFCITKKDIDNCITQIQKNTKTQIIALTKKMPSNAEIIFYAKYYKYVLITEYENYTFCLGFNSIAELKQFKKLLEN